MMDLLNDDSICIIYPFIRYEMEGKNWNGTWYYDFIEKIYRMSDF